MRAAFALRINSGKNIYNFGIAERLRTLRYSIFTGRGRNGNDSKKLPLHREMQREFKFTICYLFLYIS